MFLYLVGQSDEFYAKQTGQERGTWSESVSFHSLVFSLQVVANEKKHKFSNQYPYPDTFKHKQQLRTHSLILDSWKRSVQ